jgi:dATP pyrophosphohydrolase
LNFDGEVSIAVVRCGDEYLAVKRAEHDTFPGKWEFPGGMVDRGESVKQSARRELEEEAGITAEPVRRGDHYSGESPNGVWKLVPVLFEVDEKQPVQLSHEHTDYTWVTLEEMRKMDTLGNFDAIQGLGLEGE